MIRTCPIGFFPPKPLVVGEMSHVIPWTDARGDIQDAGHQPAASRGVHDEIGRPAAPVGCRRQRLRGECELGSGLSRGPLHASAAAYDPRPRGHCVGAEDLVESWPWNVVGIGGHGRREACEGEAEAVGGGPDEGRAGFLEPNGRYLFLDAQTSQHRYHGGDQGLAHQQLGTPPELEKRHLGPAAGQDRSQGRSRWAGPQDGHPQNAIVRLVCGSAHDPPGTPCSNPMKVDVILHGAHEPHPAGSGQVAMVAALENADPALVAHVLGVIARAKGMSKLARERGLERESLYKALSAEGNPELATVFKVIRALGLRLHASGTA